MIFCFTYARFSPDSPVEKTRSANSWRYRCYVRDKCKTVKQIYFFM